MSKECKDSIIDSWISTNACSTSVYTKTKYAVLIIQLYLFIKLACITRKTYILIKPSLYVLSYDYIN